MKPHSVSGDAGLPVYLPDISAVDRQPSGYEPVLWAREMTVKDASRGPVHGPDSGFYTTLRLNFSPVAESSVRLQLSEVWLYQDADLITGQP